MNKLSILFLDIETLPNIVYNWKTGYDITIPTDFIVQERSIFCIGYKLVGTRIEKGNFYRTKGITERSVLKKFSKIMEKADLVVAHNGDKFDLRWLKARNLILGLKPLPDIKSIDTLKLARSNFDLNSNKLAYLAQILGLGNKQETGGFDLWKGVMEGQVSAVKKMVSYCNKDVDLLEQVYLKLAPHVKSLSLNIGRIQTGSEAACPHCGSIHTIRRGHSYTQTVTYVRRQCKKCFKYFRGEKKKH